MNVWQWVAVGIGSVLWSWAGSSYAQDEPAAAEPRAEASASPEGEVGGESSPLGPAAEASVAEADASEEPSAEREPLVLTGSRIRRPALTVDDALIIDSPLTTSVQDREHLERRRQYGGIAPPDTTTALGLGAAGTSPSYSSTLRLRAQPTLVLLNGRRLVAAPFTGPGGSDFVDLNQIPITLVDRVETTRGMAAGLWGDGAVGGVVNFITHRDYDGVEVDVGGQATDSFDQHEEDVTLTVGVGSEDTGMNAMVSYFTRQPLAAGDRDWIGERRERVESLVSSPASYLPLVNFNEYPYPDPACEGAALQAGHATGHELRVRLFGEPTTRDGRNALDLLPTSPINYPERYLSFDETRGDGDGVLEDFETSTYCAGDFTPVQDLIIDEQRVQAYATLWHRLGDHLEGFGEFGYYRSDNENRTAPSFPVTRVAPDPAADERVLVPSTHADQPIHFPGFSTNPDAPQDGRAPNLHFLVGRTIGLYAGANEVNRDVDVLRGVLGLRGDLEEAARGSLLESWDWELAGTFSASNATTRVDDVLLNELRDALASCPATVLDTDSSSPTFDMQVPSTIKQRQEMGCFNPFYSSVTNNIATDPLDLSDQRIDNDRGFPTTDSETDAGMDGFGLQDGGYICDPNDPTSPCPAELDSNGDGLYDLAGTPNTQQVIERITGEHITDERRTLGTVNAVLRGSALEFDGGGLSFGVGADYRRETLRIDYDAAYNQRLYAFVFGAPDVPQVIRNVGAGFADLRLRVLDGLLELQPGARVEVFDDVGTGVSALGALSLRPFAASAAAPEALEWLLLRAHIGRGHRAPSLLQLHGRHTEFHSVEWADRLHFFAHQVVGNPELDFEKYTTLSAGVQWDYAGLHVGADFWTTQVDDVIGNDNLQTLLRDCEAQFVDESRDCPELRFVSGGARTLNHIESDFDNLAEVETNGIDGAVSYTLDTQRQQMGGFGTFVVGVQGRFLNQYLIKSPRALREFYRIGGGTPELVDREEGSRDYSMLTAEYDAAGFRNLENFAPPLPKLRFTVPLSWSYDVHRLGVTMRYVGEYNDDSEHTIEKYGLAENFNDLSAVEGERIAAWAVFDASYGLSFGEPGWRTRLRFGVVNLLDEPPPEAEGPLGYDIGMADPRGRMFYVRATGEF